MKVIQLLYLIADLSIIGFILVFLYKQESKKPLIKYFFPAITFKILSGLALGLIYQYYYKGGDTFHFFKNTETLAELLIEKPLEFYKGFFFNIFDTSSNLHNFIDQPRSLLLSKIMTPVHLICGGNYYIISAFLSLFSFIGLWKLANCLATYYPTTKLPSAIAFLFFPSVVFWSSGVIKESVVMGIIGLVVSSFIVLYKEGRLPKWYAIIFLTLGAFILLKLKYYYAALLFPVMLTALLTNFILKKGKAFGLVTSNYLLIWVSVFAILVYGATYLHPNLDLQSFMIILVQNHDAIFSSSQPDSLIYFYDLQPEPFSFLINMPKALLAGLFRPLLWDWGNIWQIITSFENMVLVFFFAFSTDGIKKISTMKRHDKILLFSVVVYIVLLASTMAFASPNFGSLTRYKIGYLPFFIYIILSGNQIFMERNHLPIEVDEIKKSLKVGQ